MLLVDPAGQTYPALQLAQPLHPEKLYCPGGHIANVLVGDATIGQ